MWGNVKAIALLLSYGVSQITGQALLAQPILKWEQQLFGTAGDAQFLFGNGVFLKPDGSEVVTLSFAGKVSAFDTATNEFMWDFTPTPAQTGFVIRCNSGISFTPSTAASQFMVFAISYVSPVPADSYTRVITLDLDGNFVAESGDLEGVHSGSPVTSSDGKYVFLNHNSADNTIGHFTVLTVNSSSLDVFLTSLEETSGAFAPVGIYHSPAEGFYDPIPDLGIFGTFNVNDILMWQNTPQRSGVSVQSGSLYAFQFPLGFDGSDSDGLSYFILEAGQSKNTRAFQTVSAPLIANNGYSAYWPSSRSQYYNFIAYAGLDRARFNRGPNDRDQFTRNAQWAGQPCWAVPAITTAGEDTVLFGPTASAEIFRYSHRFAADGLELLKEKLTKTTTSFVFSTPVIDPLNRAMYYVESNGLVHQANFDTLEDIWTYPVPAGVQGPIALSADGAVLYAISIQGRLQALQLVEVANTEAPTPVPVTDSPVATTPTVPPVAPSAPTSAATTRPTARPTPAGAPTAPTATPGEVPSADPAAPSSAVAKPMLLTLAAIVSSLFL